MKGEVGAQDPWERTEDSNGGVMKSQVLSPAPSTSSRAPVEEAEDEALFSWKTFSCMMTSSTIVCLGSFQQQKMGKWGSRAILLVSFWFLEIGGLEAFGRQQPPWLLTGGAIRNCTEAPSTRWESQSYCQGETRAREEGRGDATRYCGLEESLKVHVASPQWRPLKP